jgi:hypothetical protein
VCGIFRNRNYGHCIHTAYIMFVYCDYMLSRIHAHFDCVSMYHFRVPGFHKGDDGGSWRLLPENDSPSTYKYIYIVVIVHSPCTSIDSWTKCIPPRDHAVSLIARSRLPSLSNHYLKPIKVYHIGPIDHRSSGVHRVPLDVEPHRTRMNVGCATSMLCGTPAALWWSSSKEDRHTTNEQFLANSVQVHRCIGGRVFWTTATPTPRRHVRAKNKKSRTMTTYMITI